MHAKKKFDAKAFLLQNGHTARAAYSFETDKLYTCSRLVLLTKHNIL